MIAKRPVRWAVYLAVSVAAFELAGCSSHALPRDAGGSDAMVAANRDAGGGSGTDMDAARVDAGQADASSANMVDASAADAKAGDARATDANASDIDASSVADDYCNASEQLLFRDAFDAPALAWNVCEEIVGTGCSVCGGTNSCPAKSCYGSGLASVELANGSLRITAGRDHASPARQSDHVIAGHKLSESALDGSVWYRVKATISANTATTGQTGPEISIQSTDASHHTLTAGVQYLANVFDRSGHWNLWSAGGWHDLTTALKLDPTPLVADTTYEIALGVNCATHAYVGFRVGMLNGSNSFDLSQQQLNAYAIAPEAKGFDPATVITLEAENRHNGCNVSTRPTGDGMSYVYAVSYDDVVLCQR